jgi:hypothetical protein
MLRRLGPAVGVLLAVSLLAACGGGTSSEAGATTGSSHGTSPSASTGSGRYQPTRADFRAVDAVLERRARAVRDGDLGAFLATVDRSDTSLVSRERMLFANMTRLPLASLHYAMDMSAALVPARIPGNDPVLHPQITEFLQLTGSLVRPVTNSVDETFVRRGHRWVVGAESTDEHDVQWRPWSGAPIAVLRTAAMTVIVDRSRASTLSSLTRAVHDDIAFDAARLGVPATYRVVVDATSSGAATTFSSLSKEEAAAVTFGLVEGTRESPAVGRHLAGLAIKVNPHNAAQLTQSTPLLRHELTHYLLRSYSGSSPTWLSEGIATWIQYYPDSFSALAVPQALYSRLMRAERTLPTIGLFNDDPDVNYVVSQAAVAWLVSHYGMPKLIELMHAYRTHFKGVNADAITTRMLREVYGVTRREVVSGAFGLIAELHH